MIVGCIVCLNSPCGTKVVYSNASSDYGVGIAAINENFFLARHDRFASSGIMVGPDTSDTNPALAYLSDWTSSPCTDFAWPLHLN